MTERSLPAAVAGEMSTRADGGFPAQGGRPRAARRVLHDDFRAACAAVTSAQLESVGLNRGRFSRMRAGHPLPVTAGTLDKLRALSATLKYAGPMVASTLPVRHSISERRRLGALHKERKVT